MVCLALRLVARLKKNGYDVSKLEAKVQPQEDSGPPPNSMSALSRIPGSQFITGPVEAGANMLSGMVAKPVSEVFGLAAAGYDALRGNKDGNPLGFKEEVQRSMTYEPRTRAGQLTAEYNPLALIGRGVNAIGGFVEGNIAPPDAGPFRQAVGAGVHEAINQAPQFLGSAAKPIIEGVGSALKGGARNTMQSALKPTIAALRTGKADKAITTLTRRRNQRQPWRG